MKLSQRERFLAKVCPDPATGCWLWQGAMYPNGYGCAQFDRKKKNAHRVAWILFRGAIPAGMVVCHKCDVPRCVNPDHLFVGSTADNARDMTEKGRGRRGQKHPLSKLTDEQAARIKSLLAEDRMYMSEIAREFGVSPSAIKSIKLGLTWRHVPLPKDSAPAADIGLADIALADIDSAEDPQIS
jgi:hypothetical protein